MIESAASPASTCFAWSYCAGAMTQPSLSRLWIEPISARPLHRRLSTPSWLSWLSCHPAALPALIASSYGDKTITAHQPQEVRRRGEAGER